MATQVFLFPVPGTVFEIADHPGTGSNTQFGTDASGQHNQAALDITNLSNGVEANNDRLIRMNDISMPGKIKSSSIFIRMSRTIDTYANFRIVFSQLSLDIANSSYSLQNSVDQISIYRGSCTISWDHMKRRWATVWGKRILSMIEWIKRIKLLKDPTPITGEHLSYAVKMTSTFNVSQNSLGIVIDLNPLTQSYFSGLYNSVEIICDSGNPVRLTPPARFNLINCRLVLSSDVL